MFPLLRHCVLLAGLTLLVTQGAPAQTPAGPPKAQQHPIPLRYRSAAQGNLYAALIFVVPGIGIICGGQPKRTRHKADCAEPRAGSWFRGRKLNSGKGDDE